MYRIYISYVQRTWSTGRKRSLSFCKQSPKYCKLTFSCKGRILLVFFPQRRDICPTEYRNVYIYPLIPSWPKFSLKDKEALRDSLCLDCLTYCNNVWVFSKKKIPQMCSLSIYTRRHHFFQDKNKFKSIYVKPAVQLILF